MWKSGRCLGQMNWIEQVWSCPCVRVHANPAEGTEYVCVILPPLLCPGHGSGVERWTEEDCAHLPASHCRQERVNTNSEQNKKSAPYQQCFKVLFLSLRHHWGAYISATGVQTGTLWNRGWHGERGRAHEFLHQWPAKSFQPDGDALPDSWPAELWLRHGWHTQR